MFQYQHCSTYPAKFVICLFFLFPGGPSAEVNMLTGQSQLTIPLFDLVSLTGLTSAALELQYTSASAHLGVCHPNERSQQDGTGFGWKTASSYIWVTHEYTVDINDDRWFYIGGQDEWGEIIRDVTNGKEKFYLMSDPFTRVEAHWGKTPQGYRVITGWTITLKDGTLKKYGCYNDSPEVASRKAERFVPCFRNSISRGENGWSTPKGEFYYRWDLSAKKDLEGGYITYHYDRYDVPHPLTGLQYTRESYLSRISSDNGTDAIHLTTNPNTNPHEGRAEQQPGHFDFYPTRHYASAELWGGNRGEYIAKAHFIYSGDEGRVSHLNAHVRGLAKRLLVGIRSERRKDLNYQFEYYRAGEFAGYIRRQTQLKTGRTTVYSYENKNLGINHKTSFPTYDDKGHEFTEYGSMVAYGEHIYLLERDEEANTDEGAGSVIPSRNVRRLHIYTKIRGKWNEQTIPNLTNTPLENVQIFPYDDRILMATTMVEKGDTTGHIVRVYEYKDRAWFSTPTFERWFGGCNKYANNNSINPEYNNKKDALTHEIGILNSKAFFLVFEEKRGILYVYNLVNGRWTSSLSAPDPIENCETKCGPATGIEIECGHDGFIEGDLHHPEGGSGWNWPELRTTFDPTQALSSIPDDEWDGSRAFGPKWTSAHKQVWTGPNYFIFAERIIKYLGTCPEPPLNTPTASAALLLGIHVFRWVGDANGDGDVSGSGEGWLHTEVDGVDQPWGEPNVYELVSGDAEESSWNGFDYKFSDVFVNLHVDDTERDIYPSYITIATYPDYYLMASSRAFSESMISPGMHNYNEIAIRHWNPDLPVKGGWTPKLFWDTPFSKEGEYVDYCNADNQRPIDEVNYQLCAGVQDNIRDYRSFIWPDPVQLYYSKDAIAIYQYKKNKKELTSEQGLPSDLSTTRDHNYLMLYRLRSTPEDGLQWQRTYISPTPGAEETPLVYNPTFVPPQFVAYAPGTPFSKRLLNGKGKYPEHPPFYHFIRGAHNRLGILFRNWNAGPNENDYGTNVWTFQWDDQASDPRGSEQAGAWVSVLNGPTQYADAAGQGTRIPGLTRHDMQRGIWPMPDYLLVTGDQPQPRDTYFATYNWKEGRYESPTVLPGLGEGLAGEIMEDLSEYTGDPVYVKIRAKKDYFALVTLNDELEIYDLHGGKNSGTIAVPVVKSTTISPGPRCPSVIEDYSFSSEAADQRFLPRKGGVYFSTGERKVPGKAGATKYTYDINSNTSLFGTVKQIEHFCESDITNPVARTENQWNDDLTYSIANKRTIYVRRLTKQTTMLDGVETTKTWPLDHYNGDLDGGNGLFSLFYRTNHDGTFTAKTRTFAYQIKKPDDSQVYAGMEANNMLTQIAGETVYQANTISDLKNPSNAINSEVTTWNNSWEDGSTTWRPSGTYIWGVPTVENGLPMRQLANFDFETQSGSNWEKTTEIQSYAGHGKPLHVATPINSYFVDSLTIYGTRQRLPIGTVVNATHDRCGIYTCDYDLSEGPYVDRENGWLRHDGPLPSGSIVEVNSDQTLFGHSSIYVRNAPALAKILRLESDDDSFIYSCWVRPVNTNPIHIRGQVKANGELKSQEYGYTYDQSEGLTVGMWQQLEFTIDISKPLNGSGVEHGIDGLGDDDLFYCWIGSSPGLRAEFYMDGLRVHPEDAIATTTYYHPKWRTPILTLDAANQPSDRLNYDEYGRVTAKERAVFDQQNRITGWKAVSEREYHLSGETTAGEVLRIVSPAKTGGAAAQLTAGEYNFVRWAANPEIYNHAVLEYSLGGNTWTRLEGAPETIAPSHPAWETFAWKIPEGISGTAWIRISNKSPGPEIIYSDVFTIVSNSTQVE